MEEHGGYFFDGHLSSLCPMPPPHLASRWLVFLTFSYRDSHRCYYISSDPREAYLTDWAEEGPLSFGFWMDFELFNSRETAYDHLLWMLSLLPVPQHYHVTMAEKIFGDVRTLVPSIPAATRALSYCFNVRRVTGVFYDDRVLVEMRNCGMVPTTPEALRLQCVKVKRDLEDENREEAGEVRAVKKRRVEEEEENCTICLEELGEFAAVMPCDMGSASSSG